MWISRPGRLSKFGSNGTNIASLLFIESIECITRKAAAQISLLLLLLLLLLSLVIEGIKSISRILHSAMGIRSRLM